VTTAGGLLAGRDDPRPWQLPEGGRPGVFTAESLYLGRGDRFRLEVVVASAASQPNAGDVRNLWKRRRANRPAPVLLLVRYPTGAGERVALCGPAGEDPPVVVGIEPGQAERIALSALGEPSDHAAIRFLADALAEVDTDLPGLRNSGMFSTHELRAGVPGMPEWAVAASWGRPLLGLRGQELVRALGFDIVALSPRASVLRVKEAGIRTAIAVFLEEHETPDGLSDRFDGNSPITHALAQADAEQLPFVVLTRGSQIRVYAATRRHAGVGRKGRADTFIEANLTLIPDGLAGYLPLIFGAQALIPEGTFEKILDRSHDYGTGLADRLRQRVYEQVVPALAEAVAAHHRAGRRGVSESDLADLYETAMVILFRLLFVAYAEDRDLLPYRSNGLYRRQALKSLARDLADMVNEGRLSPDPTATSYWDQVGSLWRAVDQSNRDWGVPQYDGGMFSSDTAVSPVGARIAALSMSNAEFAPALVGLLVDQGDAGVQVPVDFRDLSVREFGTIYEGLLESSLSVAPADLTIGRDGTYVPAAPGGTVVVRAGDIYLHNRSGARKASGSYFTKPFAVEHLLDHALEPALDDHLARLRAFLDADDEAAAAEAFFDFRVADIAMGSGHFLVAAVDRIEARLSNFLSAHPLRGVTGELERLRAAALKNLGETGIGVPIEQASLLRRQIARRCIYGVDLNLIAVELARLGMWIHTFVPGLPLSFLDHNLVQGNSLTGIGTLDEALQVLVPDAGKTATPSLFRERIEAWLNRAGDALRRLARVSDADAAEIKEARKAHAEARAAVEPARRLFDLLVAVRLGEVPRFEDVDEGMLERHPKLKKAEALAHDLQALHFPIAFPEVFARARSGFDCILGNPPWEEATVEELGFWTLRFPGLKSMSQADQRHEVDRLRRLHPDLAVDYGGAVEEAETLRRMLVAGPYPGMGTGDPDLYKAFAWRFWHLVGRGGAIGVVLPRSALSAVGSTPWREKVLAQGAFADTTLLLNRAGWVFDDAEHRYTVGLVSIRKGAEHVGLVSTRGPFRDLLSFLRGVEGKSAEFPVAEFVTWTTGAAFPLLPSPEAAEVFLKLRRHPRFDSGEHLWKARPVAELHATNDKGEMILAPKSTRGLWPVYKGASFNLWQPDTGEYYAWADPAHIKGHLQSKRLSQVRKANSAFFGMPDAWVRDPKTLPCLRPRVAFRDVARATDSRTVIACLAPPEVVIANQAPYLLTTAGGETDEVFVLGVLSSIPLDWYARRGVETHINFHLLNAFPIPNPARTDPLRRRVVEIAGRLAAVDDRFADWAAEVGVPVGSVTDPAEKDDLIAELDAAVALLYGLEEADVRIIFETFHEGWDYRARLDAVLAHFRRLAREA
jgi:hypothetical protein